MLNISSKTKSHILVLIFGPHVPLWMPSIVTLHISIISSPTISKKLSFHTIRSGGIND